MSADWSDSKDNEKVDRMLVNHYLMLRSIQKYSKALFCIGIEANYGGWQNAGRIADVIQPQSGHTTAAIRHTALVGGQKLGNVYLMHHDPKAGSTPGIWTSDEQKIGGAEALRQTLMTNSLCIASEFTTQQSPDGLRKFKTKLLDQITNFRQVKAEQTDSVFQKPKWKLSGKGGGRKDDLCVALQLLLYWRIVHLGNAEFRQMCLKQGIEL